MKYISHLVAIVALCATLGCAARVRVGAREVNEQGREALRTALRSVYASHGLNTIENARSGGISREEGERIVAVAGGMKIDFTSLAVRGSGEYVVVRAEITVDGKPPIDGVPVRYFRMKHGIATNHWTVQWESNEADYKQRRP